jgi:hypothetical protein
MHATLFPYVLWYGEQRHGADGCPGESRSCWGVVPCPVLVQERLRGLRWRGWLTGRRSGLIRGCCWRGPVRGTMAIVAMSCPRAPQQRRDVATASGVAQQWRGWSHRADSDGDDRSRRPGFTTCSCVSTEKTFEGAVGPPSRARWVSRMGVGRILSRSWHRPFRTVLHSGGDGLPQGVGGTAPRRDSWACQSHGARPTVSGH